MSDTFWLRAYVAMLGHKANQIEALVETLKEVVPGFHEKYEENLEKQKQLRREEAQSNLDMSLPVEKIPLGAIRANFDREPK